MQVHTLLQRQWQRRRNKSVSFVSSSSLWSDTRGAYKALPELAANRKHSSPGVSIIGCAVLACSADWRGSLYLAAAATAQVASGK